MPPAYPGGRRRRRRRKPPTTHAGPIGGRPGGRPHQTVDETGSPMVYPGNSPLYNPNAPPRRRRGGKMVGLDMR